MRIITLDFRSLAKIEDKHSRSRCSEIQPQKVDREKLLYRINSHRLVYIIIALMVNIIWLYKSQSFNTQATMQKRTENRCHFRRVIFLCSLESFITKSLQDRKSYKQIIHLSTVCSNSQARRRRVVGDMEFEWSCVDVVVYVYRRIYFVFWYTEEMGVIYVPFCLLLPFGCITFPALFYFLPHIWLFLRKVSFLFFLFCFLIKNNFLIRNKIKKHIS